MVLALTMAGYLRARLASPKSSVASARPLGIYSPRLPDDPNAQARLALERDAHRRSARFREAAQPGYVLGASRPSEADMASGALAADELYQIGAQLFHYRFTRKDGFGAKDLPRLGRVHKGARGGPDAYSCSECHRRGGPAGAGDAIDNAFLDGDGDRPASALERNPPSLAGLGIVELLAREMTAELRRKRDGLVATGQPGTRIELVVKNVSFGTLALNDKGEIDSDDLQGVDPNLEVKPFGWKGHSASLYDFVEDELALHHGMQSEGLVATGDVDRIGPFGGTDPDGDGVIREISEGQLTALTLFVAMQEVPRVSPPPESHEVALWSAGAQLFERIGCASCHVSQLVLDSPIYELAPRAGGRPVRIDLSVSGAEPRLAKSSDGKWRVHLYSDLKRHDLGRALREPRRYRGVRDGMFLTAPLWGIARSRPYLHDGSAPTIEDAILAHGGEAHSARLAYSALDDQARAPLRVFLQGLTRARRMSTP
jgi:hypothetical protein